MKKRRQSASLRERDLFNTAKNSWIASKDRVAVREEGGRNIKHHWDT